MAGETAPQNASLAVWGLPAAVAAGESFAVKVGVKSAGGCALAGARIEVAGEDVAASGLLGATPWPGSEALYFAEVVLRAPDQPGSCAFAARFDPGGLAEPHRPAAAAFSITVTPRPEHTLTVEVAAGSAPIEAAQIRLGPYRGLTDANGVAELRTAAGRYDLVVWKAGYDTSPRPLDITADAAVRVEAVAQPEDDPDARWTA